MTIVLAGFGCKGLSATQQAATKPVTLEYWTVFDDVDAIKSMINSYRATRPYLTVNIRQLRVDEFYQRLVEALAEDRGPDIVSIRSKALRAFQSKLAPMPASFNDTTVVIEKTTFGQNTVVTQTVKPLLTPSQLDKEYVQAVKNDVILDGQIYGLPLSLDTMAIYYNKDLLDRSSVPEPPKTWEEFAVAVKKITKYDKQTNKITQSGVALGAGNNIPGADDLLSILFAQSGVDFVNRGGAAVFNSVPQNKERGVETPSMGVMNFIRILPIPLATPTPGMKKCQTLWINLLMVRWDFSLATLIIIRLSNPARHSLILAFCQCSSLTRNGRLTPRIIGFRQWSASRLAKMRPGA